MRPMASRIYNWRAVPDARQFFQAIFISYFHELFLCFQERAQASSHGSFSLLELSLRLSCPGSIAADEAVDIVEALLA